MVLTMTMFLVLISLTKIMSFVYCNKLTSTPLSPPSVTPVKRFFEVAYVISPLKLSATMRKRNGESGSPCLNHLYGVNSLLVLPLIRMETELDDKYPFNPFFMEAQSTYHV